MRRAPSGYQFSRDAFDLIGREKFGEAWTGDLEYRARSGLWTIAEYEKAKVTPGSGMRGSGAAGIFVAPSTDAPATDDPASKGYQAEREARVRYEWAEPEFIARLESGQLAAFEMDPWSGKIKPIPRDFWRTSAAHRAVNRGKGPDHQAMLLISVAPTAVNSAAERREKLGGAPFAADWPALKQALKTEIQAVGFPSKQAEEGWRSQADVVRWIEERLGDAEPGRTALKDNVKRMLEEIRAEMAGNR
ncbi:hypothetical protein [Bradyrhizobium elkanii]|uniref:hypothetical protein n=1 Tax=Bradyrhizobium elkanii TaxID=29448 RepID=UPI0005704713|nr:hypothetical protein [Bradyrhizobium elkanii]